MKHSIWILFIGMLALGFLVSCGNNTDQKAPAKTVQQEKDSINIIAEKKDNSITPAPVSEKEKSLLADMNKYPDSLILTENLIQYYRENGNYGNARKITDESIAKNNRNPRLYYIKATLAYEDEDTLTAIKAFEKAVSILPDPDYYISLATLYAQTKNPRSLSIADALISGSKAHKDKDAWFIKGLYYSNTGQKQKAISFFDKALNLSYTFMDAYREKALALSAMGRNQDAIEVLNKGLTIMNSWDEGYYYSGMILEKMNNIQDAITSYKNALVISPDYTEAKDALLRLGVQ